MGYDIKVAEVKKARSVIVEGCRMYLQYLGEAESTFNAFCQNENFKGKTASAIDNYIQEMHVTLIEALKQAASELMSRLIVYDYSFTSVDTSESARISEDELEGTVCRLTGIKEEFAEQVTSLNCILESVSDIYSVSVPNIMEVSHKHECASTVASRLNQEAGMYEAAHVADCVNISGMLDEVLQLINVQTRGTIGIATYSAGAVFQIPAFKNLKKLYENSVKFSSDQSELIAKAHNYIDAQISAEENLRDSSFDAIALRVSDRIAKVTGKPSNSLLIEITEDLNTLNIVAQGAYNNVRESFTDFKEEVKTKLRIFPTKEEHFSRNDNMPVESLPKSPNEAKSLGWDNGVASDCHQFTAGDTRNEKWVSPDGKFEVIFNAEGDMVTASEDYGTYNFCSPNEDPIGHFVYDVIPWFIWGNAEDDKTTWIQRVKAFLPYV